MFYTCPSCGSHNVKVRLWDSDILKRVTNLKVKCKNCDTEFMVSESFDNIEYKEFPAPDDWKIKATPSFKCEDDDWKYNKTTAAPSKSYIASPATVHFEPLTVTIPGPTKADLSSSTAKASSISISGVSDRMDEMSKEIETLNKTIEKLLDEMAVLKNGGFCNVLETK